MSHHRRKQSQAVPDHRLTPLRRSRWRQSQAGAGLEPEQPASCLWNSCLEELLEGDFLESGSLPTMELEPKLGSPGLYSKCFYQLSHLTDPKLFECVKK